MSYKEWLEEALSESSKGNTYELAHFNWSNDGSKESFRAYISYKQWEESKRLSRITWWLTLATWVLAIATILLIIFKR